jgi:putative nucleotidyltransferase with HDIG domain
MVGSKVEVARNEADCLAALTKPVRLTADLNGLSSFARRNSAVLSRLRAQTAVSMVVHNELMGLLFLSPKLSGGALTPVDLAIINPMARHVGIAIYNHRLMISLRRRLDENRRLYREMRNLHQQTVRAFGAAIDLKDAYTKGHSDRVARYAEAIAREMGVMGTELENISVAAYLHDIGKIVIERSIINNPRPLTDLEFRELNKHVVTGYEILSNIGHPWNEIAYMTKCHHEKIDGTGYPQGLAGEDIPLGARIVTVADSFDAMITDRPYRSRLPLETALSELHRNTGRQFDPHIVLAFCKLMLKEVQRKTRGRVLTIAVERGFDRRNVVLVLEKMIAELTPSKSAARA